MDIINLIKQSAEIPSYSTEEQQLHPFIYDFINTHNIGKIEHIHKNNLIVHVPSNSSDPDLPLIALTAHLDKINHFKADPLHKLPVTVTSDKIIGQLDDAVGVGICLLLAYLSRIESFPPLVLLFSEMEENGEYINPEQGLISGLGAKRISEHLMTTGNIPQTIITIDTTPFYRGTPGISLYSRFWELCEFNVTPELIHQTEKLESYFLTKFPGLNHQNNTNDFITYGRVFNSHTEYSVPSIALEPAIYPYHQKGEGVFLSDIHTIVSILSTFLNQLPAIQ